MTLSGPAPAGGAAVAVTSGAEAQAPALVTVPAGSVTATFSVPTLPVSSQRAVTIVASYGGGSPFAVLTLDAATAYRIVPRAGDLQSALISSPFATPFQAEVLDALNNPVPGVAVTFSAPASGPAGTFANGTSTATTITGLSGVASSPTFTANGVAGSYLVAASAAAVANPAYFFVTNQLASGFYTLTPCRLIDTRNLNGPYGGPALAANVDRAFILAGQCGIPASAKAVSINVTITQPTAQGDLRLYPGGAALPLTSVINYRVGQTRANNAMAALGSNGDLVVHCDQASGIVQFIIDVNGYYQ